MIRFTNIWIDSGKEEMKNWWCQQLNQFTDSVNWLTCESIQENCELINCEGELAVHGTVLTRKSRRCLLSFCRELMVRDPISCWRSVHSPKFKPELNCYKCLGLNRLFGFLFFSFWFCPLGLWTKSGFMSPPVFYVFFSFFFNNIYEQLAID